MKEKQATGKIRNFLNLLVDVLVGELFSGKDKAGRRKKKRETITTEKPAALVIRMLINEHKTAVSSIWYLVFSIFLIRTIRVVKIKIKYGIVPTRPVVAK